MGMSQEEIDKLMDGGSGGEQPDSGQPAAQKPAEEKPGAHAKTLERIAGLFSEAVKNILPILVSAGEVEVSLGPSQEGTLGSLLEGLAESTVCFAFKEAPLTDGLFIGTMELPLALDVSQKMMGQEGEEALSEALLSALNEAFNNVLGAFDTSIKEEFDEEVEHADLKFLDGNPMEVVPQEAGLEPDAAAVLSAFTVKLDGQSGKVGILMGADHLEEIHSKHPLPGEKEKPGEAPVEAAVEQEVPAGEEPEAAEVPEEQPAVAQARFEQLEPRQPAGEPRGLELVLDVPLSVSVELGRKTLSLRDILSLVPGSLVELDKLAGEAVDLLVNGKLFARGEVVTIDENFGVRISSIVTQRERVERLK